jgi:hypothetical protein
MERQKFEDAWKDAFISAELEPSETVWTNVELGLEKDAGGKMKRRLLFFQLLAAASMVFAMGLAGNYYLNTTNQVNYLGPLAQENQNTSKQSLNSANETQRDLRIHDSGNEQASANPNKGSSNNVRESLKKRNSNNFISSIKANTEVEELTNDQLSGLVIRDEKAFVDEENKANHHEWIYGARFASPIKFQTPSTPSKLAKPDAGEVLLAKLAAEEARYHETEKKKKRANDDIFWTALSVGAGTFNPNTSGTSTVATLGPSSSGSPASSNPSTGSSYSVGVNLGGRVSKRFVIQGGVSYLTQNSEFTSSASVGRKATLNEFSSTDDNTVATSPYQVNNNLQFVSVPVQAGYIMLDRAFAIQLNGGVSTDFFLQSTLTPEDSNFDRVSQSAGSDSPYRTINFSGLVGTEFSYRFADRYRIAINPGIRYAINSIYKSEIPATISPVTFDVSLRFKYIIN